MVFFCLFSFFFCFSFAFVTSHNTNSFVLFLNLKAGMVRGFDQMSSVFERDLALIIGMREIRELR